MKIFKIKNVDKDFVILPGKIYNINIENEEYSFSLLKALREENDALFLYYIDYKPMVYIDYSITITNILDCNPNSKKNLNVLYKKMNSLYLNETMEGKINIINQNIEDFCNELDNSFQCDVEYDPITSIDKILDVCNFRFLHSSRKAIEMLVEYIKVSLLTKSIDFIITCDFLSFVPQRDLSLLVKELELLGLTMINITFSSIKKSDYINGLIIDADLCEI